jgi:hypothetical protein
VLMVLAMIVIVMMVIVSMVIVMIVDNGNGLFEIFVF